MTKEDLLANLAPIRVPLEFAEFTYRDCLLALSLGLFAGLLLTKLISVIFVRRLNPTGQAQLEIEHLSKLGAEPRLVGLAALLARFDPGGTAKAGLQNALYDPKASVDAATIETAILHAARTRK